MRSALVILASLAATPAAAHAFLATAEPAVGATVAAAPAVVTLHFTEAVESAFSTVTATDGAGRTVAAGPAHAGGDARTLVVPLRAVAPGTTVRIAWHAVSVDTHRTEGRFTFTVRAR